jgi:uncharacterized protein (DUF983 family)
MGAYIPAVENHVPMKLAARRALLGRCPCCGEGKLFRAYLKQVENCAVCRESFGAIRADDAAPWLTIIVVGHIFIPLMLVVVAMTTMPAWASAALWSGVFVLLSLAILPRAKALFIAILWRTGAPGSNKPARRIDPA